jgi:choline dehydrogenase
MTTSPPASPRVSYDYVVAGAGSAGCVLASRLSEDPSVRVLVLEAGPADQLDEIRIPLMATRLLGSDIDWDYRIEPQENYSGSPVYPRGKTLGGSSAINLMIYIRGNRTDFDGWNDRGCTGWDYASVLPYFIRAENNSRFGGPLHGQNGPLHVEDMLFKHELCQHWLGAAAEWGLAETQDFNGENQIGSGTYQVTCHGGWRWSAADGYLKPVSDRPNLDVQVSSRVTRVLVDGTRATGVEYLYDGSVRAVHAEAEVILSGGAINSPQLLLLSGVGPAEQLRAHNIGIELDLPGVGENLHDHTFTPMIWAAQNTTDLLQMVGPQAMAQWQEHRGGPFASNGGGVGGFLSTTGESTPNVQFLVGPSGFVEHCRLGPPPPSLTTAVVSTHPKSRGRVTLRSDDPSAPPRIDPRYFTDPGDLRDVTAGLRAAFEIGQQNPINRYVKGLQLPMYTDPDDNALTEHARRWSQTCYHPAGTCAMGVDERAVVDLELKVRGIDGLRVVDASVMPSAISGNINAATIMIAEKAADLIKADH